MEWCMGNDNQIIIMSNARSHLEKAISLNPEFAEAYYELGVLLKEENSIEECIKNYIQAVKKGTFPET